MILAKSSVENILKKDVPVVEDLYDPSTDSAKEHLNIVFMGHVDAGKSTMGGHLLYVELFCPALVRLLKSQPLDWHGR